MKVSKFQHSYVNTTPIYIHTTTLSQYFIDNIYVSYTFMMCDHLFFVLVTTITNINYLRCVSGNSRSYIIGWNQCDNFSRKRKREKRNHPCVLPQDGVGKVWDWAVMGLSVSRHKRLPIFYTIIWASYKQYLNY